MPYEGGGVGRGHRVPPPPLTQGFVDESMG